MACPIQETRKSVPAWVGLSATSPLPIAIGMRAFRYYPSRKISYKQTSSKQDAEASRLYKSTHNPFEGNASVAFQLSNNYFFNFFPSQSPIPITIGKITRSPNPFHGYLPRRQIFNSLPTSSALCSPAAFPSQGKSKNKFHPAGRQC